MIKAESVFAFNVGGSRGESIHNFLSEPIILVFIRSFNA